MDLRVLGVLETSLTLHRYERNSFLDTLLYTGTFRQNSSPHNKAVETGR